MAPRAPLPRLAVLTLAVLATASPAAAQPEARYRVTFEATWSAATHPVPADPHFSPLVGGTHDGRLELWCPGGLASFAIEEMAEKGRPRPLAEDVQAAVLAGTAGQVTQGVGIDSPGVAAVELTATTSHPLFTLVTMVAPSPDWFVGVAGLPLRVDGRWIEGRLVDLFTWDAGTDSGRTFTAPDLDTQPPEPIALLGAPLGNGVPLGRYVIERIDAPPVPPLSLAEGAYRLAARWQIADGTFGSGHGETITPDTGSFWFFTPNNLELVVKVLDGCAINGHRWVFAAGLTSVAVDLTVTEVATGREHVYRNPVHTPFRPIQDTLAFPCP